MRLMCVVTHQTSAEVGERRVRKAAAHLVRVLWPLRGTPRRRTAFAALSVDSGDADDEWKRGSALCGGKERVLEGFGPPGVLFLALRRTTGARARRGSSLERHRFSGFEPKIRTKIRRYGRRYENPNHQWEVHLITEPLLVCLFPTRHNQLGVSGVSPLSRKSNRGTCPVRPRTDAPHILLYNT